MVAAVVVVKVVVALVAVVEVVEEVVVVVSFTITGPQNFWHAPTVWKLFLFP